MKILKKFLIALVLIPIINIARADDTGMPIINVRKSVFSTSVDWEAVSGLRYSQHRVKFISDNPKLVNNGLELYIMDGFPCYGQASSTRIWIGANNKTAGDIRLTCLFAPKTLNFAWRNSAKDARQEKTTGIIECPVTGDYELSISLSKCTKQKEWKEYK